MNDSYVTRIEWSSNSVHDEQTHDKVTSMVSKSLRDHQIDRLKRATDVIWEAWPRNKLQKLRSVP